jgi:fructosamine-3-kinase
MTHHFGGFPQKFYDAYNSENPLEAGYEDRRDLYNLYQLLNHLNLFGATYLGPVLSILDEYVDQL